jgi:homoserine O-acetyltransferase
MLSRTDIGYPEAVRDDKRPEPKTIRQIFRISSSLISGCRGQRSVDSAPRYDRWIGEQLKTRLATTDSDDLLYAIESSSDYDPSAQLDRITAPLLAINSADDFINPPELGILEAAMKRVKRGRYILIPVSDATHGHSTHTWAAVWERELRDFLAHNAPSVPQP